jgi:glycosyltransferase involved in cell wall biosynthesis
MKVLFISTPRAPTLNVGSNGLGRHVYDFISKFVEKDCKLSVIAHPKSVLEWENVDLYGFNNEHASIPSIVEFINQKKFDVIIDNTHHKRLSTICGPEYPILNFIHDEECPYMPPNTLLGNNLQKVKYPKGRVYRTGIKFKDYPLFTNKKDYFSFCGKLEKRKGFDLALEAANLAKVKIIFAGPDVSGCGNSLPEWVGEITNHEKFCEFVGNSKALFYPSRADAGGMGIWEACALGTPVLTTTASGAQCNVIHDKTGYVAQNTTELSEYCSLIEQEMLNPEEVREAARSIWDLDTNFEKIYDLVVRLSEGERW